MANSTQSSEHLEGFHEVNLASPTTPDLQQAAQRPPPRHSAPPPSLYRTSSLGAAPPPPPSSLRADQLPTQPVYPAPPAGSGSSVPGSEAEPAEEEEEGLSGLSDVCQSVVEVREKGGDVLKDELLRAQRDLRLKDEECERLSKVRDQLGQELEELTASLFEEAHKMVREANVKQTMAEKQLKEALGKIDVLQAEVLALKTLVLSSPTSPVGELPPAGLGAVKAPFRKGHGRNKSTSSVLGGPADPSATQPIVRDCREVDSQLYTEFRVWREGPTMDRKCCFLDRIYREDIFPCLAFRHTELGAAILDAVEQNTLSVEPVGFQTLPVVKASAVECGGPKSTQLITKCALSGQTKTCKHRIKFGDSSNYYYVSPYCRYRITSVCNFFTYIRYIHQGLVKQQDAEQMFWEVMQLRREMSLAKLGFYKDPL